MTNLCFFFEDNDIDVWSGRHIDLEAWNYAAKAAGDVARLVVVNTTDQILTPGGKFEIVDTLPLMRGRVARFVGSNEGIAPISLWDFDHKVDWYTFGPAAGWGSLDLGFEVIQVTVPQANKAALHAVHIASTVMLHRYSVVN